MDDPDASAVTILYETGERYLPMLYDELSKETPLVGIVNRYDALREVVGIG